MTLQTPWVRPLLRLPATTALTETKVVAFDGKILGGAAGVIELAQYFLGLDGIAALTRLPGCLRFCECAYRFIANHRPCAKGACKIQPPGSNRHLSLIPLLVLPIFAAVGTWSGPPWAQMWCGAFALYVGLKWFATRN